MTNAYLLKMAALRALENGNIADARRLEYERARIIWANRRDHESRHALDKAYGALKKGS